MTQIHNYIQHNDTQAFLQKSEPYVTTIGTYNWFIGTGIFFLVTAVQFIRYLLRDSPPAGLKLVPGPWSTIPYIGRVHDVDPMAPWYAMKKFSDQYNGFFRLTICGEMHIWVGDAQISYDLLCKKAAIYSSRPMVPAVPGSDSQGQYLPLLEHGDHWRKQRKFAHTVLSQSFNQKYYGYVTHEATRYIYKLMMDPLDHFALTDRFCGRISARLNYGKPDSAAAHCKNAGEFIPQISPSGPITNLMPFLGSLPEWINPSIKAVRVRREKEEKLWKGLLKEVRDEMDEGTAKISYAKTYFERKENETGSRSFGFDDTEAAYAVGMLCTVAIFTIGGPLYCFLLAMVLHPEWQEKARKEIDEVLGDRMPTVSDSPNLPLLRAVIKECIRWRPPVPLGVPRLLEEDDEYNGYYLPKGAVIHAVDLALARDEKLYPDPETYNPARWLEPEYPTYKEPLTEHPRLMGHHGFGMGRRMCPGIDVTEAELLVACGALLFGFEMKPYKNSKGEPQWPDSLAFTPNLIGGPLPFKFDCAVRSPEKAARIKELYEQSVADEAAGRI
jgi:cytochrome P450